MTWEWDKSEISEIDRTTIKYERKEVRLAVNGFLHRKAKEVNMGQYDLAVTLLLEVMSGFLFFEELLRANVPNFDEFLKACGEYENFALISKFKRVLQKLIPKF